MATERITERVTAPFAGSRVDRAAGVIRDVLICGTQSKNGYQYGPRSFGDGSQYEKRPVYLNHPGRDGGRRIEDKIGWFENVSTTSGRPRGDFHLLKSHPAANQILEGAERNAGLFGFSHIAMCSRSGRPEDEGRIESVDEVESIDLVAEPATTQGLFEGKRPVTKTTFGKLLEGLSTREGYARRKAVRKFLVLAEDDSAMAPAMDAPVDEPAEGADPDEALWSGFTAAIQAILDKYKAGELDKAEASKAIGKYLSAHARLTDGGSEDPDAGTESDEGGEGGGDYSPSEESRRRVDPWALLAECQAEQFTPSPVQIKALSLLTDPADRKAFIAECRRLPEERATSSPRVREGVKDKAKEAAGANGDGRLHWQD